MAARRLVTVMLVLLGVSIIAAALVPPPPVNEDEQVEDGVRPPPAVEPGGKLVRARIDAGAPEPRLVELRVGDQLALTVRSQDPDQVEIPALGELQFVGPLAPARFDILAWEEATYAVRLLDADRLIGRIDVGPARRATDEGGERLERGDRGTPDTRNGRDE